MSSPAACPGPAREPVRREPQPGPDAMTDEDGNPRYHVIALLHPSVPPSLTDESLWSREECERDAPQAENDMPGTTAIVCELHPVRPYGQTRAGKRRGRG